MNYNENNIGEYLPSNHKFKVGSTVPFTRVETRVNNRCLIAKHLYRIKYNGIKPSNFGFVPLNQLKGQKKATLTILAEVPQSALHMRRVAALLIKPEPTFRDIIRFYVHRPRIEYGDKMLRAKMVSPLTIKNDYLLSILAVYASNKQFCKQVFENNWGAIPDGLKQLSLLWNFDALYIK